jgi:hypothetical protein
MHITIYTYNMPQNNHGIFRMDLEQQKFKVPFPNTMCKICDVCDSSHHIPGKYSDGII